MIEKGDLPIAIDRDVKWVYHRITSNVDQHIAPIIHSIGHFAITLDSRASNLLPTNIHDLYTISIFNKYIPHLILNYHHYELLIASLY